jgi:phosphoribosylformimino-5-aminoimidazole carboxamide ribotide isomerase
MIIYPAIDLQQGQCVRLYQGDYQKSTVYHVTPLALLEKFSTAGAAWVHIIDLDGAKDPQKNQANLIISLIKSTHLQVQTGGGIRTKEQAKELLDAGAARIIVGSLAVRAANEVANWLQYFGAERLVLALDIIYAANNQPMVAINGWQITSKHLLSEVIKYYQPLGLQHLLCTSIVRDGTLSGLDCDLYTTLQTQFPWLAIQASGGIHTVADFTWLREQKIAGAIVGRALYENQFTLQEALSC